MTQKTGVFLINLGTPDDTSVPKVRRYLRQFLSDPRVIDINPIARWMLLNLAILPFRPKQSAEAYREIWTDEGSPLLIFSQNLTKAVADLLGDDYMVRLGMRYQNPSMEAAMAEFRAAGVERIIALPLYPQYASSSTGSCLEELYRIAGADWNTPSLAVVPPFYDHPAFLDCQAEIARESLGDLDQYDAILMSYHGIPERHITKSEVGNAGHCLKSDSCCDRFVTANRYCYRAQCFHVSREIAKRLNLSEDRYYVTFQSRLGRTPWIRPYTDIVLEELPAKGVKKLGVLIPSFTADCLETLEEIEMRGLESFVEAGGESLKMVPSLNDHPKWVEAVCTMVREQGVAATTAMTV
ncbi:ferrochelatase [Acanthopleuribacter pedis]|uniref:Ferrochelatase n=1 Tax=Acanthopleuribacter pedis TaxID=442870 RepID=A0A8J7Q4C1_9BACT|nr:ferrochelatase [Acanthopleuribacter pedis]MBO1318945.1 ferrochelatase [Acanthopleuribacter pedis]